jgi:glycerol-3-phosphate dehydrogenase (NAD(P)+)
LRQAFILGAGAWGTALGLVLAERFDTVWLWDVDPAYAAQMEAARENTRYLPGVPLAPNMHATDELARMQDAALLVLSVPSQYFRQVWTRALPHVPASPLTVVATKGLEPESLLSMRQVAAELCAKGGVAQPRFVTLSGPSHAEEVGLRKPTTVVTASPDESAAKEAQAVFGSDWFRVYTSPDPLGVEIGGALKNVIALAAGVSDGLGLGDNAKAALMTRGLAEMTRLGVAMGARAETFAGLAGMGDLVVTCISRHSRNRGVGERLGRGETWAEIQKTFKQAVEGAVTARSAVELGRKHKVELPICREVHAILYEGKSAQEAFRSLLTRPLKEEA